MYYPLYPKRSFIAKNLPYILALSSYLLWSTSLAASPVPLLEYKLIDTQAHNSNSFIQGWIKDGETFYESSGLYGKSFVQRHSSRSTSTAHLPRQYFAEGLTLLDDTLYLLTWRENTLLVINPESLKTIRKMHYKGEGWGLSHDNHLLIMSNGTNTLYFRDPETFTVQKTLMVKFPGLKRPLQLNELEYVAGVVWANDWQRDTILAIDGQSGCILGQLDVSKLRVEANIASKHVLNGIAYDASRDGLWITGKYWPKRFLIMLPTLIPQSNC